MKRYCIIDLQFGSTGKGLLAGYLGRINQPTAVVTAWGPNAGHTWIGSLGGNEVKMVHRMLANGITSPMLEAIFIGPGSVIDKETLAQEISNARRLGMADHDVEILIHEAAAVLGPMDAEYESRTLARIGSTMKGTAEAMIRKIRRESGGIALEALNGSLAPGVTVLDNKSYVSELRGHKIIQFEGAQGFSLGIDHGFYPYTTSRNCTIGATLQACGVPYDMEVEPVGVLRTYPIRVANRPQGTSGPGYPDQDEIEWSQIGVEPELTTVTKLPRRIFTFSAEQVHQAISMSRIDVDSRMPVFLNFVNYIRNEEYLDGIINHLAWAGASVAFAGFGPHEDDIVWRGDTPGWADWLKAEWSDRHAE